MTPGAILYFGVKSPRDIGHYLYGPGLAEMWRHERGLPRWLVNGFLDASLCPVDTEIERVATLSYVTGWTVLSFWDRSGDSRGQSNSSFAMAGIETFTRAVERAQIVYPMIFERLGGPLVPHASVPEVWR